MTNVVFSFFMVITQQIYRIFVNIKSILFQYKMSYYANVAFCNVCFPQLCQLKVNNRNSRTMFEICSKLTIKTTEWSHWCRSGVFFVNSKQISHICFVLLLLTLNKKMPAGLIVGIFCILQVIDVGNILQFCENVKWK